MLNHEPLRLADGEYRFACLVWDNEPLPSGQLVALAAEGLGWKKSTTYTVLKKLCERGVLQNADGRVTSLIKKEDVQQAESAAVVDKTFDGSLPRFVAALLNSKPAVGWLLWRRGWSAGPCAAPMRPVDSYAGCGWP